MAAIIFGMPLIRASIIACEVNCAGFRCPRGLVTEIRVTFLLSGGEAEKVFFRNDDGGAADLRTAREHLAERISPLARRRPTRPLPQRRPCAGVGTVSASSHPPDRRLAAAPWKFGRGANPRTGAMKIWTGTLYSQIRFDVGFGPILLQKSKVATPRIFREDKRWETIADSYTLNRVAEIAGEFDARGHVPPHLYTEDAPTARRIFDHLCKTTFATVSP